MKFLESLETDPDVAPALFAAGKELEYSRAMALLAANTDRLQIGLLPARKAR